MDTENMQIVESQVSNVDIAEEDNDEQSQKRKKQIIDGLGCSLRDYLQKPTAITATK